MGTRIIYVSGYSNITSQRANLTNVLYMADALGQNGTSVALVLFVPIRKLFSIRTQVSRIDKNLKVSVWPIPYAPVRGIYLWFDMFSFVYALIAKIFGAQIYTRNCRFARWLYPLHPQIGVELHDYASGTKACVRRCRNAHLFPISKGIVDVILADGLRRDITLLPDAAVLAVRSDTSFISQHPAVAYVGSSNPGKGINTLVALARQTPDIAYYLVGAHSAESFPPNLKLLGYMNKHDIRSVLEDADVLVAPYESTVCDNAGNDITNYMSPLKVFEYMASGTPFVVSRMGFATEFLDEGTHCLMAAPEDLQEWERAIRQLLGNAQLAERLASGAKDHFEENFTWLNRAEIVKEVLIA